MKYLTVMTHESVTIDLSELFEGTAKLSDLAAHVEKAKELAGSGNEIILTGAAPVWLYLKIAHALHGKAKKLIYRSPVTGDVVIFDHDPF
ncbi:MAG: CRISPR-associated protein Csx3 [Gammaproteobacteria bacterium]